MLQPSGETISSLPRDHPDWRRGREVYALWLIELDLPQVADRVAAARSRLAGLLQNGYGRQPHITLFVCGFPAGSRRYDDDFTPEQLRQQERDLARAAVPSFAVEIGGLKSFTSAAYLEVHDRDGGLERLRAVLFRSGSDIGRTGYVPHVTVGLYAGAFPGGMVIDRMNTFPREPLRHWVRRITFATYQAREAAGSLTFHRSLGLAEG